MHQQQMQSMNQMMSGGMFGMPSMMPALMNVPQVGGQDRQVAQRREHPFGGLFGNMEHAMSNMQSQMVSIFRLSKEKDR